MTPDDFSEAARAAGRDYADALHAQAAHDDYARITLAHAVDHNGGSRANVRASFDMVSIECDDEDWDDEDWDEIFGALTEEYVDGFIDRAYELGYRDKWATATRSSAKSIKS